MGRWTPDASGRLQQAAMELFLERGYDDVTIADIAERAGLTKRSFFNHFSDKREVMFAPMDSLSDLVVAALREANVSLAPLDAAVWAFTQVSAEMEGFADLFRARRTVVDSASELRERELSKIAALSGDIAEALVARGVGQRYAEVLGPVSTSIYANALEEWSRNPKAGLVAAIQDALTTLRAAVAPTADVQPTRKTPAHRSQKPLTGAKH
jgi:AcrR family transcriptional regulator